MYMQTIGASSAPYDFRKDFSAIATPGLHRYLRECGYDPDEPSSEIDDCWESGRDYSAGVFRALMAAQSDYRDFGQSADLELYGIESWSRESVAAYVARRLAGILDDLRNPVTWDVVVATGRRLDREAPEKEKSFIEKLRAAAVPVPNVVALRSEDDPKPAVESMFRRVGFLDAKPREWLVRGFIPRNEVCNPFGRPNSFKGVSAAQLAVHIAGGVDFLGLPLRQAPTAYFAGERGEQAKRQIKGHVRRLGLPYDLPCYFGGKPVDLLSKPDLEFLIANIKAIEGDAGAPLGFLVIDTQSRTMGGDENSTKDGAAYAKAIEAIRQATDATLWIIAHTGHSEEAQDRPRGSSTLLGAYDTFYRHKKTDERSGEIKITIDRDGLGGKELQFSVALYNTGAANEDGEPVLIPYLEAAAPPVKITFKKGGEPNESESPTRGESEALRALHKAIKKQGLRHAKGRRHSGR